MAEDDPIPLRAALSSSVTTSMVQVLAVRGSERMSAPYAYVVDAVFDDLVIEGAAGKSMSVVVSDERGQERHVHGQIERMEVEGSRDGVQVRARIHLAPPARVLAHRHGFAIFQEMTVPDIVKQVFTDAGLAEDRFRWDIQDSYEAREYVVQYDETEWDFVSRLLEDEGIWYTFEHEVDGVVMVFGDRSDVVPALDPAALNYLGDTDRAVWGEGHVHRWTKRRRLVEGKVALDEAGEDLLPDPRRHLQLLARVGHRVGRGPVLLKRRGPAAGRDRLQPLQQRAHAELDRARVATRHADRDDLLGDLARTDRHVARRRRGGRRELGRHRAEERLVVDEHGDVGGAVARLVADLQGDEADVGRRRLRVLRNRRERQERRGHQGRDHRSISLDVTSDRATSRSRASRAAGPSG